jgi:hypothetical protein
LVLLLGWLSETCHHDVNLFFLLYRCPKIKRIYYFSYYISAFWSLPRKSLTIITRIIGAVKLFTWISSHAKAQQKFCTVHQKIMFGAVSYLKVKADWIFWKWDVTVSVNRQHYITFFTSVANFPIYAVDSKLFNRMKVLLRNLAKIKNYIICVGMSDLYWQGSCKYNLFRICRKCNLVVKYSDRKKFSYRYFPKIWEAKK